MDEYFSQEIKMQPVERFTFATTGISKAEVACMTLPESFVFSQVLTPTTKVLFTYKALFTEKHIQALMWNIPIASVAFLYNPNQPIKKYEFKPFQGAVFSSSSVLDEIYINFLVQSGAVYEPNVSIFVDFLLCDNEDSEKYTFCRTYGIPVIKTADVFNNNYDLYRKRIKYDAKQLKTGALFIDKSFYIDQNLPKKLFNAIRRVIVENEGSRVNLLTEETDYIITHNYESFIQHKAKLIHYQYVFDCVESKAVLHAEFYRVNASVDRPVLGSTVAVVNKETQNNQQVVNKLKALGAVVKTVLDARITHYITETSNYRQIVRFHKDSDRLVQKDRESISEDGFPFKLVSPEWVDQCLTALRHLKETRYMPGRPVLNLRKRVSIKKEKNVLFQFTGLPSLFKQKAIEKLNRFELSYSDSDKFENCTYLIMGTLNFSEKLFCAIVSGCWILRPDFIEDFENEQNFDYEKYEWQATEKMSTRDKKIAESIRKWRKRIQNEQMLPFMRWNVRIYAHESKFENYKNLILYGGGSMNSEMPYNRVFVDKDYKGEIEESKYLKTDAIFSYLFR